MSISHKKSNGGGAGQYYVDCSTMTADDYYAQAGAKEPPGEWYCGPSHSNPAQREQSFGMVDGKGFDAADIEAFAALVRGFEPVTRKALVQNAGDPERVALHDFTFSAPKSVSVAWALADAPTKAAIQVAQREAVRAALDLMSSKAAISRQGKGSKIDTPVSLNAALWEHGSSRDGDPQLHTHATVLNVARRPDGSTGALETNHMMVWQGAAAETYHAVLSSRLADLGFRLDQSGPIFELADIPEQVRVAFSSRREEIKSLVADELAHRATDSAQLSLVKQALAEVRRAGGPAAADAEDALKRQLPAAIEAERRAALAGQDKLRRVDAREPEAAVELMRTKLATALWEVQISAAGALDADARDALARRAAAIEASTAKMLHKHLVDRDISIASRDLQRQATLETRDRKDELTREQLQEVWTARAKELGFGHAELEAVRHLAPDPRKPRLTGDELDERVALTPHELTEHDSTFSDAKLHAAVARAMGGHLGVSRAEIERQAERLKSGLVLMRDEELPSWRKDHAWTTTQMVWTERRMVELAKRDAPEHALDAESVEAMIADRSTLSEEQADAIRHVTTDKRRVSVVQGAAGAGKTFATKTVVDLYKAAGYDTHALAQSWEAATTLAKEAGLSEYRAITGWLHEVERGKLQLKQDSLVIVDEAGLVGAKQMRRILEAADKAGAKVVLSGDQLQIKSIEAGASLRNITEAVGAARLDTIRRQKSEAERAAVSAFFDGRADDGLRVYRSTDRVRMCAHRADLVDQMTHDWSASRTANAGQSHLMLAAERELVAALNRRAHEMRRDAGELGDEVLRICAAESKSNEQQDEVEFRTGDRVAFRSNRLSDGVNNRRQGEIEHITEHSIVVKLDEREGEPPTRVTVDLRDDGWFSDDGKLQLQHAYATTVTSAQGLTVDRVFAADSVSLDRAAAGVMMSRHRHDCRVYVDRMARHERMMKPLASEEYRPLDRVEDRELIESMVSKETGWSSVRSGKTTLDYSRFHVAGGLVPESPARIARKAAMEEAKRAIDSARETSKRDPYIFQTRKSSSPIEPARDDRLRASREHLLATGVTEKVMLDAERTGVLEHDARHGPTFVARWPARDGGLAVVRAQAESVQATGERTTPMTATGSTALALHHPIVMRGTAPRVHLAETGRDALALWSDADRRGEQRPTVVIASTPQSVRRAGIVEAAARGEKIVVEPFRDAEARRDVAAAARFMVGAARLEISGEQEAAAVRAAEEAKQQRDREAAARNQLERGRELGR